MAIETNQPRIEATVGRTEQEIAALNAGTYSPSVIEEGLVKAGASPWARRITAAIAALGGLAAVHYVEPRAIPAIVRSVEGALDSYRNSTALIEIKPLGPQIAEGAPISSWWVELTETQIKERTQIPNLAPILWTLDTNKATISPELQAKANSKGYEIIYQANPEDTVGRSIAVRGRELAETSADIGFGNNRTLKVSGILKGWVPNPDDPTQKNSIYTLLEDPIMKKEWVVNIELGPYTPPSDDPNAGSDSMLFTWFNIDNLDNGPEEVKKASVGTAFEKIGGLPASLIPDSDTLPENKWKQGTDLPTVYDLLRKKGLNLTDLVQPGDYVVVGMKLAGVVNGQNTFLEDENGVAKASTITIRRFGGKAQW